MYCPRCNENIEPVDNCCPQCGRTLATKKVESRELTAEEKQAWVRLAPLELEDPLLPEIPDVPGAGWLKGLHSPDHSAADVLPIKPKSNLKELEAELRSKGIKQKPVKNGSSRLFGGLFFGGGCAAAVSLLLFAAGGPGPSPSPSPVAVSTPTPLTASEKITADGLMTAIKSSKPGKEAELLEICRRGNKELKEHLTPADRKILQSAQQRAATKLAADQIKSAEKAVANKDWNRAVGLAEASLALNLEVDGPKQQRQQAKALIATVEENLRQQRLSSRPDSEQAPVGSSEAPVEVPSLGEGSAVPVASRGSGRVRPGAPAPTQIQPVVPTKPAKPASQPAYSRPPKEAAPDLGNRGVLPGYNTKSQYK